MMNIIKDWFLTEFLPFVAMLIVKLFLAISSLFAALMMFPLHIIRSLLSNYNLRLISLLAALFAPSVTYSLFKVWIISLKLDASLSWLHTMDAGAVVFYLLIAAAYWAMFYLIGRVFLVFEAAYEDSLDVLKH